LKRGAPEERDTKPAPEKQNQNEENFLLFARDEHISFEKNTEEARFFFREFPQRIFHCLQSLMAYVLTKFYSLAVRGE